MGVNNATVICFGLGALVGLAFGSEPKPEFNLTFRIRRLQARNDLK